MNKIKDFISGSWRKASVMSGLAFASLVTLAEEGTGGGTSTTPILKTTVLQGKVEQIQDELGNFVDNALPVILTIAGAFMIFWLARIVLRLVKSFGNGSK